MLVSKAERKIQFSDTTDQGLLAATKRIMNTPNLVLFSTDHCTLCEQALDLLFSMPEIAGFSLQVIDVADDHTDRKSVV